MQVLENKGICNAGDIWAKDGKYLVCPDYKRIAELEKYTQSRKSKDKAFISFGLVVMTNPFLFDIIKF